jgi:hypothetical protein
MTNDVIFIEPQDLANYGFTSANINSQILRSATIRAQDRFIEPVLGSPLYERLAEGIAGDDLTSDEETLLSSYIRPYLITQVELKVMRHVRMQIRNKTAGSASDASINTMENDEFVFLQQELKNDADFYLAKLKGFLCDNESTFPLYTTVRDKEEDVKKNSKGNYFNNISVKRNT